MSKHIVSIYTMLDDSVDDVGIAAWEEKIGDTINYLLLLKAIVVEERVGSSKDRPKDRPEDRLEECKGE